VTQPGSGKQLAAPDLEQVIEDPPDKTIAPKAASKTWLSRKARRIDFAERDALNLHLAKLGEQFVFDLERYRLTAAGRDDLAQRVIWALGLIHEGKPDSALATALVERIDDNKLFPPGPEDIRVRRMAAITVGRMQAREKLADLRCYRPVQETTQSTIGNACGWAIAQITGEQMRTPRTTQKVRHEGFLLPLK
jgi:hypothetical protein